MALHDTVFAEVKRRDPERAKFAALAPARERRAILALLAFDLEVSRISHLVHEPTLALIRLQWWKDGVAEIYAGSNTSLGSPVAEALKAAIRAHALSPVCFERYFETWEGRFISGLPVDAVAHTVFAGGTAGEIEALSLEVLGGVNRRDEALRVGTVWGLVGTLRSQSQEMSPERACQLCEAAEAEIGLINPQFQRAFAPVFLKVIGLTSFLRALRGAEFDVTAKAVRQWRPSPWKTLLAVCRSRV